MPPHTHYIGVIYSLFFLFCFAGFPLIMTYIATSLCAVISCVSQTDPQQLPVGVNLLPLIRGGSPCVGTGRCRDRPVPCVIMTAFTQDVTVAHGCPALAVHTVMDISAFSVFALSVGEFFWCLFDLCLVWVNLQGSLCSFHLDRVSLEVANSVCAPLSTFDRWF